MAMRILLACAALVTSSALAGEVYKCKGPKGEITFTNIKCPENAAAQHYGSFQAEQNVPKPDAAAVDQGRNEPLQAPVVSRGPTAIAQPAPTPVAAAGYQCSVGSRIWIQSTPCPATSTQDTFAPVSGVTANGERISGSADVKQVVPVQQNALSHDALCHQLAVHAKTGEQSDSSYERNKLRGANGCH